MEVDARSVAETDMRHAKQMETLLNKKHKKLDDAELMAQKSADKY